MRGFSINGIFLSLALLFFCAGAQAEPASVRIGVIIAQTGPAAWWGRQIIRGVEISDEQNDSTSRVEFLFEDDEFSAKTAVTAAMKLLQHNRVHALITFGGGSTAAVAEIAERSHIPLIGISAASAFTQNRAYAFRLFMSNESQIELLTRRLDALASKRVALVTTTHESMLKYRELFRAANASRLVFDEEVAPAAGDMKTLATRVKRAAADSAVFFVNPPNLAPLTKSLREQHFIGPFLGGVSLFNPGEIRAAAGALIGAEFPGPSRETSTFTETFHKRFSEAPSSEALYGYDAAKLLIDTSARDDMLQALRNTKVMNGMGGEYQFRGNSFEVPASLWQIRTPEIAELAEIRGVGDDVGHAGSR